MQEFSLLVKPASADCNLRCQYCFYLDRASVYPETSVHRMSDAVLERMISSYMATKQTTYSFGWQGGEPTLMGAEFFKKVTAYQQKHGASGASVSNGLQTNGTLITDELATHLAEYKFLLGVSIDGPADIHDSYRLNAGGAPTHAMVMRGIETIRRHNIEFNTLTLVTQANARRGREVYEWLTSQGFLYHQYIPCVEFDHEGRLAPFSLDAEAWGQFLCDLFDGWYPSDTRRVSVRLFDSLLNKMVYDRVVVCHLGRDCRQYFVVEHNGDIYPCDFFVRPELRLGNIVNTTWEQSLASDIYTMFGKAKAQWNEECNQCQWLCLCAGDCMKHRQGAPASPRSLSVLCAGMKRFFAHTYSRFKELAEGIRADILEEESQSASMFPAAGRNDLCPCGSGRKFKKCCGSASRR